MIRAALGHAVTLGDVLIVAAVPAAAFLVLWGRNGFRGLPERR